MHTHGNPTEARWSTCAGVTLFLLIWCQSIWTLFKSKLCLKWLMNEEGHRDGLTMWSPSRLTPTILRYSHWAHTWGANKHQQERSNQLHILKYFCYFHSTYSELCMLFKAYFHIYCLVKLFLQFKFFIISFKLTSQSLMLQVVDGKWNMTN